MIASLGLIDLVRCVRIWRKNGTLKISWIISYLTCGILFTPWFILCMIYKQVNITKFWPDIPSVSSIFVMADYLYGYTKGLFNILGLTGIILIYIHWTNKKKDAYHYLDFLVELLISFAIIVTLVFVYSAYINPYGSIWMSHYFLCYLPHLILFLAYSMYHMIVMITNKKVLSEKVITCLIVIMAIIFFANLIRVDGVVNRISERRYREAATIIMKESQDNPVIYWPSVSLVSEPIGKACALGWNQYYFDETAKIYGDKDIEALATKKIDKLFVFLYPDGISENQETLINQNYSLKSIDEELGLAIYIPK